MILLERWLARLFRYDRALRSRRFVNLATARLSATGNFMASLSRAVRGRHHPLTRVGREQSLAAAATVGARCACSPTFHDRGVFGLGNSDSVSFASNSIISGQSFSPWRVAFSGLLTSAVVPQQRSDRFLICAPI
jgi:hypothetical protein